MTAGVKAPHEAPHRHCCGPTGITLCLPPSPCLLPSLSKVGWIGLCPGLPQGRPWIATGSRGYTLPFSPNCVSGKDGTWQSQSHLASPLEMGTAQWVLSSMLCTYKRSTGCGPQEYPLSRAGRWVQHLVSAFPSQWERNVKLKTSHGLTGFFFNLNFPITVNN